MRNDQIFNSARSTSQKGTASISKWTMHQKKRGHGGLARPEALLALLLRSVERLAHEAGEQAAPLVSVVTTSGINEQHSAALAAQILWDSADCLEQGGAHSAGTLSFCHCKGPMTNVIKL